MVNQEYCELTNKEIQSILKHTKWCHLGISDCDQPYIVPMYFSFEPKGNNICFTLLSLRNGQKMRYMEHNQKVCLEFDLQRENYFFSIIVNGTVTICPPIYKNSLLEVVSNQISGRCYMLY
ncbi:pyridoxamine 5'-phosphate oxidase family protein [Lachnoclostridium phytofermentans]|nr:pyridoxamine 5'-phosphate oxidase family protein [Lachnoclostridium phytofermentans]